MSYYRSKYLRSATSARGLPKVTDLLTILEGDAITQMRALPAESVHLIVTSPPYFQLRDYKIPPTTWPDGWVGALGLEPSSELYIEHLVSVMREAYRVLRSDGTLWLNMGDSYCPSGGDRRNHGNGFNSVVGKTADAAMPRAGRIEQQRQLKKSGLKAGDLMGLPWRVALAMQQPFYAGRIKKESDRIWLAAMVDGEGCIHIHRRKPGTDTGSKFTKKSGERVSYLRKNDTFGVMVSVDNTSKAIIDRCAQIVGQGSGYTNHAATGVQKRKRTLYRWTLSGDQSRAFLREIYPHLVAKQREARIAFHSEKSGADALRAQQAIKDLHNGRATDFDCAAPPSLFERGWYHRKDNIWEKPNPMPESVQGWRWEQHRIKVAVEEANGKKPSGWNTALGRGHRDISGRFNDNQFEAVMADCPGCDKCAPAGGLVLRKGNWRCTTSHEYVFQFSKSSSYFCDAEAAREKTSGTAHDRGAGVNPKAKQCGRNSRMNRDQDPGYQTPGRIQAKQNRSFSAAVNGLVTNRNLRSVWKIPTKPYRGAHFATFPPGLIRPIVKAASPLRCCRRCGGPFAPVVKRGEPRREQQAACGGDSNGDYFPTGKGKFYNYDSQDDARSRVQNSRTVKQRILHGMVEKEITGYRPTCGCEDTGDLGVPATVLDPFAGSGTVGEVALELGRKALLIELNPEYVKLIERRCDVTPGFAL